LEDRLKFAPRFRPLFEAHAAGRLRFAVTTITIAEVLTGPMKAADEALARRYRAILESWRVVALDVDIAENAARLRPRSDWAWTTPSKPRARWRSTPRRLSLTTAIFHACVRCAYCLERCFRSPITAPKSPAAEGRRCW
jgi:hypothetical protein